MFSFSANSCECIEDLIEKLGNQNVYQIVYAAKNVEDCTISATIPLVVLVTEVIETKSKNSPGTPMEMIRIPTDNKMDREKNKRTHSDENDKRKLLKTFVSSL